MRVPPNRISAIVNGGRGLTADTAPRLSKAFGTTAEFWLNLQKQFALGDSYASGQGAGFYDPSNTCLQSDVSYPELLDDVKHVKLLTDASCSGATTFDGVSRQIPAIPKSKKIDVVTLTVGANDVGGAGALAACAIAFSSPECQAALSAAVTLLTPPDDGGLSPLGERFVTTFSAVAAAAPGATILVTGYPLLFETPPTTDPNYLLITTINNATAQLNATIALVAGQLAATGVDIHYVDVDAWFLGHRIGSPDPWINVTGPDAYHPTAAGYVAYSAAIQAEYAAL